MPSTVRAELSVPSKTFLLGEYLILSGGPSLVVATSPRFSMRVYDAKEKVQNFHPDSPAGRLLQSQNHFFEFTDPYSSSGGLGASSAQFVLAQAFLDPQMTWQNIYQSYRSQSSSENRYDRPSGGDVVAQVNGGISYFSPDKMQLEKSEWLFDDLDFSLFKTSQKLATHEHLKNTRERMLWFQKSDLFKPANESVELAFSSLKSRDSKLFTDAFRSFAAILNELKFVSDMTAELLAKLRANPKVLSAKGCGAMGADVICVLHRPQDRSEIQKLDFNLKYLASSAQIETQGLRFDSGMK